MSALVYPANRGAAGSQPRFSLQRVGRTLLWILGTLLFLVLALPILLIFVATATPFYVALALATVDIALLGTLLWLERSALLIGGIFLAVILTSAAAVWASQFYATTPPITDAQGQVIPGSIATLEKVKLGDSEQWVSIRGKDEQNPILLFLAAVN